MDSTPPYKLRQSKISWSPKSVQEVVVLSGSPTESMRRRRRGASQVGPSPRKDRELPSDKPRKRRQSLHKSTSNKKKDNHSLLLASSSLPKMDDDDDDDIHPTLDRIGELIGDLVMWRHLAKSSLWFSLGSLFFLSSCFSHGLTFSVFSVISKMGFLFLVLSFFSNSICQRNGIEQNRDYKLKEEDILRFAKVILPFTNLAISKTREVFSGQPCMTLKVAPLLLLGSEYGHLITLWRLCAIGFFSAFTVPKIYSIYSIQISQKVEWLSSGVSETWGNCSRKKMVAASALTAFWNLSTLKTRILTAFISLVLIRYWRDRIAQELQDDEKAEQELAAPNCELMMIS